MPRPAQTLLGFAVMGALIALLGFVSYLKIEQVREQFSMVTEDRYPKVAALNNIALANANNARALRDLVVLDGEAAQKTALDEMASNSKLINDNFKLLGDTVTSPSGKAILAKVANARAAYTGPRDKVRNLVKAGDKAGATTALYTELHGQGILTRATHAYLTTPGESGPEIRSTTSS